MKKSILGSMLLSSLMVVTACGHKKDEKKKKEQAAQVSVAAPVSSEVSQEKINDVTSTWPTSSRAAINDLTSKYGMPDAVTDTMVVWNNSGPFERSVVYKEEVNHLFPVQHSDILQQTIDYRVPLDKVSALNSFDGSMIVDRTKGELSSRNQREEMNILAFNLADKIVRGELTVEQARQEYSKNVEVLMSGTTNKMLTALNFQTRNNTSDPDTMMQSQQIKQSQEQRPKEERRSEEVDVIIIDQGQESKASKKSGTVSEDAQDLREEQEVKEPEEVKSIEESTESDESQFEE